LCVEVLKKLHHRGVLERWGVRDVHDNGGTLHGVGQTLAADDVDSRAT
jgi:hypothetical protein